jgi:hypothetical protein
MYAYLSVCMYVCMHACMYGTVVKLRERGRELKRYVCMHVCLCACIHTYILAYIYIYIHTHIHTHIHTYTQERIKKEALAAKQAKTSHSARPSAAAKKPSPSTKGAFTHLQILSSTSTVRASSSGENTGAKSSESGEKFLAGDGSNPSKDRVRALLAEKGSDLVEKRKKEREMAREKEREAGGANKQEISDQPRENMAGKSDVGEEASNRSPGNKRPDRDTGKRDTGSVSTSKGGLHTGQTGESTPQWSKQKLTDEVLQVCMCVTCVCMCVCERERESKFASVVKTEVD